MKGVIGLVGAVVVLVLGGGAWLFMGGDVGGESIRVASFNGEIFGDAKISNVGVDYYVDLVSDYDLFFLLEIRDADNSSFYELCSGLVGYECYLSARSGRSISKEAVGVFVRSPLDSFRHQTGQGGGLGVLELNEYVDDSSPSVFERNPVFVDVSQLDSQGHRTGQGVRYWVVHLSLNDVYREMEALEIAVGNNEGRVVVLGDMNADCDYYSSGVDFSDWEWVIGDDEDTASGFKDCAYDRIIVSSGVEVLDSGVRDIDSLVSDHNLVWVEIGS